ncbi:MAG TPA: choice-of-anchor tandem repeat GloVer-containing protein [Verrucomicrobiae bacterium]|nr:choice-of-anchor tandem repeat GloVer-containing protein [Verrucomicrobiae bacterium]
MRISRFLLGVLVVMCVGSTNRANADTLKTLHGFTGSADGAQPYGGLILGSDGNYYGTTESEGGSGFGTVFSITPAGTLTTVYNFGGGLSDGANPKAGVIQGSDGLLYGTTSSGGSGGAGTVFKVGTNGSPTILHSFSGGSDGGTPLAGLVQGSDSNYYGTTASGGTSGQGTIFVYTPGSGFISSYDFTGGTNGGQPKATMTEGNDGFLFGTTYGGGASNVGTIFYYSLANGLTTWYSFTGGLDGANPEAALVQGSDSNFYGTTFNGGAGFGTVFRINMMGRLDVLWIFGDGSDGGNPAAGLIQADDGNYYGTTSTGGSNGAGTIFRLTRNGALTTLYNFGGGNDGAVPLAGLLQANSTNFLGTTSAAGKDSVGTIFNLIQPCTFSLLPSHVTLNGLANNGTFSVASSGTGCVWIAQSNADWINVTSSNSSVGPGTVTYTTTVNSNSNSRTGTITVGNKNFTITQQGEVFGAFLPGSYNGLVMDTNTPAQASSGVISLSLGKTGSFSANLVVGGVKSSFKGVFDSSGNSTNTVTRKNLSSLTVILAATAVSNATDQVLGTVSDGTFTAEAVADLAVFSSVNPSPWEGPFTFALVPADNADATVPQGYGYGTLTVTSLGSGSLKGVLGDGTKISGTFPVSGYGTWPLYDALYKNGGACIGWVTLNEDNTMSGTVNWFKQASSSVFYPNGFTTTVSLIGDQYTSPKNGGPSVEATGNLALGGGNLTSNVTNGVSIDAKGNGTALFPLAIDGLKLKVNPTTGQVSGSFVHPIIGKSVKFTGLLLQNTGVIDGYFLGTSESGFVTFVTEGE